MKDTPKRIALAGVGSAISLIFVVASYYLEIISLSLNVLATSGIMLIMSKNYYREAILSVIAVSIIGFLIVNIGVVPFVLVGGSYTVFTIFWYNKKYNYYKSLPIKIAYSVLVFFILYKVTSYIAFDYSEFSFLEGVNIQFLYVVLNIAFIILYVIYDLLLLYCYRFLKERLFKNILR